MGDIVNYRAAELAAKFEAKSKTANDLRRAIEAHAKASIEEAKAHDELWGAMQREKWGEPSAAPQVGQVLSNDCAKKTN